MLQDRHFENDFFMTIVSKTNTPEWVNYKNLQNKTSIWNSRETQLILSYLPYISDYYPGYGSMIPINALITDSRCKIVTDSSVFGYIPYNIFAKGTECDIQMQCNYDIDLTAVNRIKDDTKLKLKHQIQK